MNVSKATPVRPKGHRLILQVTFTTLVTDGAIQGMVDKEELHHTLTGLPGQVRVGLDPHTLHHGHSTGGCRLGGPLNLH